jgi:hypothetical protein
VYRLLALIPAQGFQPIDKANERSQSLTRSMTVCTEGGEATASAACIGDGATSDGDEGCQGFARELQAKAIIS